MKKLYLFTTGFPYPAKSMETYLETECRYYDRFDEVHIASLGVRKNTLKDKREVPGQNVFVHPIVFGNRAAYIVNGITAFFDKNFYKEARLLKKQGKFSVKRLIRLVIYISRAHYDARTAIRELGLRKEEKVKDAILYSYRFEYQPYVMLLLEKYFEKPLIVSRAHGYDLYEEVNSDRYIPARKLLLSRLHKVFLISDHGKNYLEEKYPDHKEKLIVSRLGILDHGITECPMEGTFRIVSCSNMVPIKRMDKIVQTLSGIKNKPVEWVHFGSGEQEEQIRKMAEERLPENISVLWKGRVPNAEVLQYYQDTPVHLFLNLSDSEGIPVSIMETMSFGIPCLATDVGGTSEIVLDGENGFLVSAKEPCESITKRLSAVMSMDEEEYRKLRKKARSVWKDRFDADKNYSALIDTFFDLCEKG